MRHHFALAIAMTALAACSSYETTFLSRDAAGNVSTKTVAGVPIVVNIPRKLGFLATVSRYRIETLSEKGGQFVRKTDYGTETTIDKTPIPLGESQLASLDIKRPLFGTAKTSMKLANQYPTELSSEVDDKTLGRALDTIDKLLQRQGENATGSGDVTKTLIDQHTYLVVYDPSTGALEQQSFSPPWTSKR